MSFVNISTMWITMLTSCPGLTVRPVLLPTCWWSCCWCWWWWPGTVPGGMVWRITASVVPDVVDGGSGVGGGLGAKQLPRLLRVPLLQIIPLVHVTCLEGRRVFSLLLEERLQLQLLLLLEVPTLVILKLLESFLLLLMDNLKSSVRESMV